MIGSEEEEDFTEVDELNLRIIPSILLSVESASEFKQQSSERKSKRYLLFFHFIIGMFALYYLGI